MAAFIIYIIRWAAVLTLLYTVFSLLMKKETLHALNRALLLFVLTAGIVIPFIQIRTHGTNALSEGRISLERQIELVENPAAVTPTVLREGDNDVNYKALPSREDVNISLFLAVVFYLAGLAVAWGRFGWSLLALARLIHEARRVEVAGVPEGVRVLTHPDIKTPCSWMCWMLLHPDDVRLRPVIDHEMAHIRLRHSWDMLLCELTCCMLWCLPFVWMLRQDMRDIHEYQADSRVLEGNITDEEYQLLLIKKATSKGMQPLVNALNQSSIKRRFAMMYRKPSRRRMALKAVVMMPLCALALAAFARPQALDAIEKDIEQTKPERYLSTLSRIASAEAAPVLPPADATPEAEASLASQEMQSARDVDYNDEQRHIAGLLDSVMHAIGARKIDEGVYLGRFQPSLNGDTVRVRHVKIMDEHMEVQEVLEFAPATRDSLAYDICLMPEHDERLGMGYHLRLMEPAVKSARLSYRQPKKPRVASADLLVSDVRRMKNPIAIEQYPDETHIILYYHIDADDVAASEPVDEDFSRLAIVDAKSGDRYMLRSVEHFDGKHVHIDRKELKAGTVLRLCLVFPPLGKNVHQLYIEDGGKSLGTTAVYNLSDIRREPVKVIN